MTTMIRIALIAPLALPACAPTPSESGDDTEGAATGSTGDDTASAGGTQSSAGPSSTSDSSSTSGTSGSSGGSSSDDGTGSEGTCGTACEVSDPVVEWIVEPDDDLRGGRCVDVLGDGSGGAIASFITNPDSPLDGGLVLSLSEDGSVASRRVLEQRHVTGMERSGPGEFHWADSYANAGDSPFSLDALTGEWLSTDLLALDDVVTLGGGYAYVSIVSAFFPECRIRIDNGAFADTPPLDCGQIGDRWRLRAGTDGEVVAGLLGRSALVRAAPTGELQAVLDWRYQRTTLDFAVDSQGRVWTVGVIKSPDDVGPSFGSFVARHGPDLAEDPQWEGLEEGSLSVAWTAIAMLDDEPILIGLGADDIPRVHALTASGDAKWELALELSAPVVLRRADLDDQGRLYLCGDRFDAQAPATSDPIVVRVDI